MSGGTVICAVRSQLKAKPLKDIIPRSLRETLRIMGESLDSILCQKAGARPQALA